MRKRGLIIPVILSGGAGSRLWPLSRRTMPKQLLPLVGSQTMIQETLRRAQSDRFGTPLVISGQDHRFLIAEQLRSMGLERVGIILEPAGRNTAPAAAIAALRISEDDPDALVLLMPSDQIIGDFEAFHRVVELAEKAARKGALVTFGTKPTSPESGYGYIKCGAELGDIPGVYSIDRFVEKPNRAEAEQYLACGEYYWNSGMFLFSAKTLIEEMELLEPNMLAICRDAIKHAHRDMDFIRLGEVAFLACPSQSIDYAVMERTSRAAVVPADMGWSDVGSWHSLWNVSSQNHEGNAILGDVVTEKVTDSYIRSEGPLVAAVGVRDVVIVATKDAVLVSHRNATQDVKRIVEQLEANGRDHHVSHTLVHRPWGSYESVDTGERFQVKRIIVKPGAKLSLQMHHHRAEHWIVVSGTALVTCDEKEFILQENESAFIPLGAKHRLENPGRVDLHLIEVQSGSYLGEDDIVRFEDTYGRVSQSKNPA